MRKKALICGNWKLNHNLSQTKSMVEEVSQAIKNNELVEVVLAPVAPLLFAACDLAKNTSLKIAAQNVFYEQKGAFTGEWSVNHLTELGCSYAIVGHSERRQYFNDSDEGVGKKARACLDGNIKPIACLGETLEQRENGQVKKVLTRQLGAVLSQVKESDLENLVIAYEPVWAIGTSNTATSAQAQEAHSILRVLIADKFGPDRAESVHILYGGSVKWQNIKELMAQKDIDGALVGGASLTAESFLSIVEGSIG
ncbi:triose-phosphate isomerase [Sulfobacillus acidophilus]|uniref:Triosephosphate isomerase n=1 Tax=Sulfobacillus acidophilus TaxID=53633 RepID=A0ABS3AVE6_9FIRM|nr:triose-phosphate isomerase [Sulfobacillus acidophilus]